MPSYLAVGTDTAFWYFGHVNLHDASTYLPYCGPKNGEVAYGPTIRLVGTSW